MTEARGTRRPGLTRERVLDAAVALAERDGAAALTMRALGRELGVEAMSLYNHVPNREALLEGLGERTMTGLTFPAGGWRAGAEGFATSLRGAALAHPETFRLVGLRPLRSPAALAPVERLLGSLVAGGATPAQALAMYRALASFARGYALAEVTGFTVDAGTERGREPLRRLPASDFPVLRGRVEELAALDPGEAFSAGLRALLDGFGARLDLRSK